MKHVREVNVLKPMGPLFEAITAITDAFCQEHLKPAGGAKTDSLYAMGFGVRAGLRKPGSQKLSFRAFVERLRQVLGPLLVAPKPVPAGRSALVDQRGAAEPLDLIRPFTQATFHLEPSLTKELNEQKL